MSSPTPTPSPSAKAGRPCFPAAAIPASTLKKKADNPTGSFKARGMSMAVTMARHYGLKKLAAPSAGNAASALAAYAAAAGIEAHIFMPRDVPMANYLEGVAYGAHVTLVDGLISDCGRMVAEGAQARRLVRRLHAEGAVPRRRQKDHGLRTRRAARLDATPTPSSIPPAVASASSACGRPSRKWSSSAGS